MLVSVFQNLVEENHVNEEISRIVKKLENVNTPLSKDNRTEFRREVFDSIRSLGWSGKCRVFSPSQSNISISSRKEDIGLCLQLGNIARYYADIIKLQHLYKTKQISEGVMVVYHRNATLKLFDGGGNLANFERIMGELSLMSDSINFPITLIGIG